MVKAIIFDWGRTLWDNENDVLFPDSKETLEYLKQKGYRMALLSVTENTAEELKLKRIQDGGLGLFLTKSFSAKKRVRQK